MVLTLIRLKQHINLNRKKDIKVIIIEFVKENYGENELENHSWDIDALAAALHNDLR